MSDYRTALTAAALRSLHSVPAREAEPLVAFIFGSLALGPRTRGKPLKRELEDRWSARRGDYRVVYRLEEETKTMYVLKIGSRADAHRPS